MKFKNVLRSILLLLFVMNGMFVFAQSELSSYLIGTYEKRINVRTIFQVVNPTPQDDLEVVMAFFDNNGNIQTCINFRLDANDMEEVIVPFRINNLSPDYGVVKIISHRNGQVAEGIVGFQRQVVVEGTMGDLSIKSLSETDLPSVPRQFANPELEIILASCP